MIRPYQKEDIDDLLDVWYKSSSLAHPFLEEAFMAKERENVRSIYIPNTKTWIYIMDRKLVGFIAMMDNEVGAIFVLPEYHGCGIGKELMDHVRPMHEILEVEVFERNSIGRRFYDKYGFELVEKHVHDETGFLLLRMKCE